MLATTLGRPARFRDAEGQREDDVADAFKSQRVLDLEYEVARLRYELRQAQALTEHGCPSCGLGRRFYDNDTNTTANSYTVRYTWTNTT